MIVITKSKDNYYITSRRDTHGPLTISGVKACSKWYYKISDTQLNIAFSVFHIGNNDMAIFTNEGQYSHSQKVDYSSGIIVDN